jgi:hypothetical protein
MCHATALSTRSNDPNSAVSSAEGMGEFKRAASPSFASPLTRAAASTAAAGSLASAAGPSASSASRAANAVSTKPQSTIPRVFLAAIAF